MKKLEYNKVKEEFEQRGYILLSQQYIKAKEKLEYICLKHPDKKQYITYDNFSHNHGCKYCSNELTSKRCRKTDSEIETLFQGREYSVVDIYRNNSITYIKYICPKHSDKTQTVTYGNFLNGTGCAYCRESKGEKAIENFLQTHKISYERQKGFDGCTYKKHLKFDFFLKDYNLCIEYQGEQHYKITQFGNMTKESAENQFELAKTRDEIKRKYCFDNNIQLLEIHYKDLKHIDTILAKYLMKEKE